eukprot:m.315728 g.315728  ORF g.315728 m.315728 type:complete len:50 (+) comp16413_c0_seq35:1404-1553(+)
MTTWLIFTTSFSEQRLTIQPARQALSFTLSLFHHNNTFLNIYYSPPCFL